MVSDRMWPIPEIIFKTNITAFFFKLCRYISETIVRQFNSNILFTIRCSLIYIPMSRIAFFVIKICFIYKFTIIRNALSMRCSFSQIAFAHDAFPCQNYERNTKKTMILVCTQSNTVKGCLRH